MEDDFENMCPICVLHFTEEDMYFNPCPCQFKICVWCWHKIIDTAQGTDQLDQVGRCPHCREPFDVERVLKEQQMASAMSNKGNGGKGAVRSQLKRKSVSAKANITEYVFVDGKSVSLRNVSSDFFFPVVAPKISQFLHVVDSLPNNYLRVKREIQRKMQETSKAAAASSKKGGSRVAAVSEAPVVNEVSIDEIDSMLIVEDEGDDEDFTVNFPQSSASNHSPRNKAVGNNVHLLSKRLDESVLQYIKDGDHSTALMKLVEFGITFDPASLEAADGFSSSYNTNHRGCSSKRHTQHTMPFPTFQSLRDIRAILRAVMCPDNHEEHVRKIIHGHMVIHLLNVINSSNSTVNGILREVSSGAAKLCCAPDQPYGKPFTLVGDEAQSDNQAEGGDNHMRNFGSTYSSSTSTNISSHVTTDNIIFSPDLAYFNHPVFDTLYSTEVGAPGLPEDELHQQPFFGHINNVYNTNTLHSSNGTNSNITSSTKVAPNAFDFSYLNDDIDDIAAGASASRNCRSSCGKQKNDSTSTATGHMKPYHCIKALLVLERRRMNFRMWIKKCFLAASLAIRAFVWNPSLASKQMICGSIFGSSEQVEHPDTSSSFLSSFNKLFTTSLADSTSFVMLNAIIRNIFAVTSHGGPDPRRYTFRDHGICSDLVKDFSPEHQQQQLLESFPYHNLLQFAEVITHYLNVKESTLLTSHDRLAFLRRFSSLGQYGTITDALFYPHSTTLKTPTSPASSSRKAARKVYGQTLILIQQHLLAMSSLFASDSSVTSVPSVGNADRGAGSLDPKSARPAFELPTQHYWIVVRFHTVAEAIACVSKDPFGVTSDAYNRQKIYSLVDPKSQDSGLECGTNAENEHTNNTSDVIRDMRECQITVGVFGVPLRALEIGYGRKRITVGLVPSRYCSSFLRNTPCTKSFCVEIHQEIHHGADVVKSSLDAVGITEQVRKHFFSSTNGSCEETPLLPAVMSSVITESSTSGGINTTTNSSVGNIKPLHLKNLKASDLSLFGVGYMIEAISKESYNQGTSGHDTHVDRISDIIWNKTSGCSLAALEADAVGTILDMAAKRSSNERGSVEIDKKNTKYRSKLHHNGDAPSLPHIMPSLFLSTARGRCEGSPTQSHLSPSDFRKGTKTPKRSQSKDSLGSYVYQPITSAHLLSSLSLDALPMKLPAWACCLTHDLLVLSEVSLMELLSVAHDINGAENNHIASAKKDMFVELTKITVKRILFEGIKNSVSNDSLKIQHRTTQGKKSCKNNISGDIRSSFSALFAPYREALASLSEAFAAHPYYNYDKCYKSRKGNTTIHHQAPHHDINYKWLKRIANDGTLTTHTEKEEGNFSEEDAEKGGKRSSRVSRTLLPKTATDSMSCLLIISQLFLRSASIIGHDSGGMDALSRSRSTINTLRNSFLLECDFNDSLMSLSLSDVEGTASSAPFITPGSTYHNGSVMPISQSLSQLRLQQLLLLSQVSAVARKVLELIRRLQNCMSLQAMIRMLIPPEMVRSITENTAIADGERKEVDSYCDTGEDKKTTAVNTDYKGASKSNKASSSVNTPLIKPIGFNEEDNGSYERVLRGHKHSKFNTKREVSPVRQNNTTDGGKDSKSVSQKVDADQFIGHCLPKGIVVMLSRLVKEGKEVLLLAEALQKVLYSSTDCQRIISMCRGNYLDSSSANVTTEPILAPEQDMKEGENSIVDDNSPRLVLGAMLYIMLSATSGLPLFAPLSAAQSNIAHVIRVSGISHSYLELVALVSNKDNQLKRKNNMISVNNVSNTTKGKYYDNSPLTRGSGLSVIFSTLATAISGRNEDACASQSLVYRGWGGIPISSPSHRIMIPSHSFVYCMPNVVGFSIFPSSSVSTRHPVLLTPSDIGGTGFNLLRTDVLSQDNKVDQTSTRNHGGDAKVDYGVGSVAQHHSPSKAVTTISHAKSSAPSFRGRGGQAVR